MTKITQSMIHNARLWTNDSLEMLGFPHVKVKIEFNPRFTSKLGDARFSHPGPRIRLSEPIWPIIPVAERRDTVIHEICHIVVGAEHHEKYQGGYRGKRPKAHGLEWQSKMRACGLEPRRCHEVDVGLVPGTRKTMRLHCPCGSPHPVTPKVYNRVVSGTYKYRCGRCKGEMYAEPARLPEPKTNSQRLSDWVRKCLEEE